MSKNPTLVNDGIGWSKLPGLALPCARSHRFGESLPTLQRWVARARDHRLDRVDWSDRSSDLLSPVSCTDRSVEDLVLTIRQQLREITDLGEFGVVATYRELVARGTAAPQSKASGVWGVSPPIPKPKCPFAPPFL
jgi:hypothetical protein